ncbi:MAG TPA: protease pro-enzyme activation domain-containing protein [Acidothermaceae bacterium]|nr:protease pro-enzyme activation domain-containing protein [Acidothermaceae bacterium]
MPNAHPIVRFTKRRVIASALSVGVAGALIAAQGATASAASSNSTTPTVSVAQSNVAPLAAGTPLGTTDPNTPVQVSVILRSPGLTQLENRVANGWTGPYLTTQQFANQYGQSPLVIAALQLYLKAYGIKTNALADRLDIQATGTAAQINKAFGVSLKNFRIKAPGIHGGFRTQTVYGSLTNPRVPSQFASPILAVLGLTNYSPFVSNAKAAQGHKVNVTSSAGTGVPAGMMAPADFIKNYNLKPIENGGAKGQGETIGIVTFAAIDPATPVAFWNTVLGLNVPASRLKIIPIDGGSPGPSTAVGSDESDLDVEQSGAIAPGANVRLYEAPNSDPGAADAYYSAASDNLNDTLSISWGESETYIQQGIAQGTEPSAYAAVFDQVLAKLGAQGTSNFASSGDNGAYDAAADVGSTNLAVDNNADSPYTTSAGGTTPAGLQTYGVFDSSGNLTGTESANIPAERAWSWDYLADLWKALGFPDQTTAAKTLLLGGGGGYSVLEPRPAYQNGISGFNDRQYFTPTNYQQVAPGLTEPTDLNYNPNPSLQSGHQNQGRGEPDLSTNADPQTGYAVYDPTLFAADGGFEQYGGTSFVSPQLNGSSAVIESYIGHRVGFWNPKIYKWANGGGSPFTPLNDTTAFSGKKYLFQTSLSNVSTALPGVFSNNNLYYTGKQGATWNPATGLGIPNLTQLAKDFAK